MGPHFSSPLRHFSFYWEIVPGETILVAGDIAGRAFTQHCMYNNGELSPAVFIRKRTTNIIKHPVNLD